MSFWKSWTVAVVIWIQITPEWKIQLFSLSLFVRATSSQISKPYSECCRWMLCFKLYWLWKKLFVISNESSSWIFYKIIKKKKTTQTASKGWCTLTMLSRRSKYLVVEWFRLIHSAPNRPPCRLVAAHSYSAQDRHSPKFVEEKKSSKKKVWDNFTSEHKTRCCSSLSLLKGITGQKHSSASSLRDSPVIQQKLLDKNC